MEWLRYPWLQDKPDYGFALVRPEEGIVGVLIAFYSDQCIDGETERFCNLAHWCVVQKYRNESLRPMRALMARKDVTLTGFSSIRRVVAVTKGLGWDTIDDYALMMPNINFAIFGQSLKVISDIDEIIEIVDDRHRQIIHDHGPLASARYTLLTDGSDWCLSVHKVEMRKRVRFAVVIYASDRHLFHRWLGGFLAAYRRADGCWLTLCQPRYLPTRPIMALKVSEPRPHVYKSKRVDPAKITGLYSELMR
ncbi:MAG: hypothetical protein HC829_04125 [Bacteroidales bacterium]|nr:hypothetical protein [Bacteroidales bacterium]